MCFLAPNRCLGALGMFLGASRRRLCAPGMCLNALRRWQHALGKCLGPPGRSLVFKGGDCVPQQGVWLSQGNGTQEMCQPGVTMGSGAAVAVSPRRHSGAVTRQPSRDKRPLVAGRPQSGWKPLAAGSRGQSRAGQGGECAMEQGLKCSASLNGPGTAVGRRCLCAHPGAEMMPGCLRRCPRDSGAAFLLDGSSWLCQEESGCSPGFLAAVSRCSLGVQGDAWFLQEDSWVMQRFFWMSQEDGLVILAVSWWLQRNA